MRLLVLEKLSSAGSTHKGIMLTLGLREESPHWGGGGQGAKVKGNEGPDYQQVMVHPHMNQEAQCTYSLSQHQVGKLQAIYLQVQKWQDTIFGYNRTMSEDKVCGVKGAGWNIDTL